MKKLFLVAVLGLLITSCSPPEPEVIDTGQPGSIKVVVFMDANRNRKLDAGENGLQERVGLSQDVSCPAQSLEITTIKTANANGEALFESIDPGIYCISYHGEMIPTTKIASEVPLSSEQEIVAYLGLTDN